MRGGTDVKVFDSNTFGDHLHLWLESCSTRQCGIPHTYISVPVRSVTFPPRVS